MSTELTREMAQQLVEFISGETGYNMIVCDTKGMIIGDKSRERLGVHHAGAARIMRGDCDSIAITPEEAARSDGKMREGYNIAIEVEGERIGTFGIGGPLETVTPIAKIAAAVIAARLQERRHLELIREVVDEVSNSVAQAVANIGSISAGSEDLDQANTAVTEAVSSARTRVDDTNQLLEFILDVADRSGLLGLNAAIIAAQAGKHGRGFAVVAEEIRKLAKNSSSSADQITEVLEQVQASIAEVSSISTQTKTISERQLHAIQQLASDIASIKASVDTLSSIAHTGG